MIFCLALLAALSMQAPAEHKIFVGPNRGTNYFLETHVELGQSHGMYVVKVDRTGERQSRVEMRSSTGDHPASTFEVGGVLENYFRWDTKLVLLFVSPETELIVLDEVDETREIAGKVLDRRFSYGCDVFHRAVVCYEMKRDKNGQITTTAHIFTQKGEKIEERNLPVKELARTLGNLLERRAE